MSSKMSFLALAGSAALLGVQAAVQGFDISHYQPNVDFVGAHNAGARFVIIKVSEYCLAGRPPSSPRPTICAWRAADKARGASLPRRLKARRI